MQSRHSQFTSPGPGIDARAEKILATLTMEERIALLGGQDQRWDGLPAKGIPALRVTDGPVGPKGDATHPATAFPAIIALAASWNPQLAERYGAAAGRDTAALGIHVLLGPGVNIHRSPLCGRNFEYAGEDPHLAGRIAVGWIRGCQDQGVSACVKHFALNFQEYDRYNVSSDIDARTLREIYLPAFRMAVDAGVASVMTAYNLVNGEWCSQHRELNNVILKGEWRFSGVVMSDWVSTHDGVGCAEGGLDLEMPTAECMNAKTLLPALSHGRLSPGIIDDKVRRLLRWILCFGWDRRDQSATVPLCTESSQTVALDVAREGCVLLKNEGLLPLARDKNLKIAVIGPHAFPGNTGGGGSSYVPPARNISIFEGLRAALPQSQVICAKGIALDLQDDLFRHSRFTAPDGSPGLLGEYFANGSDTPVLSRVDSPINLLWMLDPPGPGVPKFGWWARWTGTLTPAKDGEHVFYTCGGGGEFMASVGGEVICDTRGKGIGGGARRALKFLRAGEKYAVNLEYRQTWNYNWMQFGWDHASILRPGYDEAVRLARESEVVVFCGGHSRFSEGEGCDRDFAMPAEVEDLLRDVSAVNPRTLVVLSSGGNIDMRSWAGRVPGIMHAWYPGQEGGTAIAEIISGMVNPSGKSPITLEINPEDRSSFSSYHDGDKDRRVRISDGVFCGYRHVDRGGPAPRFAFGHGLSYTTFAYKDLEVSREMLGRGESLTVAVTITNTGMMAGAEVVQLYLSDDVASLPRPVQELKGFAKVRLEPGASARVEIPVTEADLRFFHPEQGWIAEAGTFTVRVGASSADIRLRGTFTYLG